MLGLEFCTRECFGNDRASCVTPVILLHDLCSLNLSAELEEGSEASLLGTQQRLVETEEVGFGVQNLFRKGE